MTPVTWDYKCFNTVGPLWSLVKGSGTGFKTSNALGEAVARNLPASEIIESTSVTGPGFVNIVLSNTWIAKRIQNMLVNGIQSWAPILPVKRVVLDSSSPSIANEMHVGHLRPTIIGDALAHMFEFSNVEVLRYNYVGDYAMQFNKASNLQPGCKFACLYGMLIEFLFEKCPNWEELGSQAVGNLEDFYKASKQRFDEDAEFKDRAQQADVRLQGGKEKYSAASKIFCDLRRKEFDHVYKLLEVQLEEKVEGFFVHHIPQVLEQLSREKDLIKDIEGARVIFIEGYQSPLTLFKRGGSCGYALTELTALSYWINVEKVEWIIYVTDVGLWQTFDKFFQVARMAGWLPDPKEKMFPKTSHAELGLVFGADGKREGVLLRDLLDKAKTQSKKKLIERLTENGKIVDWTDEELEKASEALGYGAIKFADLKNDGATNYTRSLDGMLSDMGKTAVYLQYALAHVCSIIRKSNMDVEELKVSGNISLAHQDERDLGLHLIRYAEAVEDGYTKLLPSVVCEYLYKLSRIFTTFCANCPMVVGSPEEASRLMLCEATAIVMRQCFELLGITPSASSPKGLQATVFLSVKREERSVKMVCAVCHSDCQNYDEHRFAVVIREGGSEATSTIPCTARNMFNGQSVLKFKAYDRRYVADVYRGHQVTVLGGDGWENFRRECDVHQGQLVVFIMYGRMPKAYVTQDFGVFEAEEEGGAAQEAGGEEGGEDAQEDEVLGEEDVIIDDQQVQAASTFDNSSGFVFEAAEYAMLEDLLAIEGVYLGPHFVHRLTPTNVTKKQMKIPRKIVQPLNLYAEGVIDLCMGAGDVMHVAYHTDNDGRMVFNKAWGVFVAQNHLQVNDAVAFNFREDNAEGINLTCVVNLLRPEGP